MKNAMFFAAACMLATPAVSDEYVRGHVRKDGTYVAPHYRSSPNSSRQDNYSTRGNTNPYTGERGLVDAFTPRQERPSRTPSDSYLRAPETPSPYERRREQR